MSLEQAINDHASAIRELAAAIIGTRQPGMPAAMAAPYGKPADTLEADVTKVETDAKAEQQKVMDQVEADRKPSTAKEAVADALAKAKAEKEAAKPAEPGPLDAPAEPDPLDAPAELDWMNDVRPVLLKVGKDRDALKALLAKHEVPAGQPAPAEKRQALLDEANAILAARG